MVRLFLRHAYSSVPATQKELTDSQEELTDGQKKLKGCLTDLRTHASTALTDLKAMIMILPANREHTLTMGSNSDGVDSSRAKAVEEKRKSIMKIYREKHLIEENPDTLTAYKMVKKQLRNPASRCYLRLVEAEVNNENLTADHLFHLFVKMAKLQLRSGGESYLTKTLSATRGDNIIAIAAEDPNESMEMAMARLREDYRNNPYYRISRSDKESLKNGTKEVLYEIKDGPHVTATISKGELPTKTVGQLRVLAGSDAIQLTTMFRDRPADEESDSEFIY
mmetsp:Transcript_10920/g.23114  ORF Transcript_10920/g.23114 Transcript_10920/m.23114 type:complete len:280 (+) Transcript_10920:364-1203(+)